LKQEELNQKLQREHTLRMGELIDFLGERVIREIEENPREGTVVILRTDNEEEYRRKIKAANDYFIENKYLFRIIGDNDESHVHYIALAR